jgi:hypothetical protein
VRVIHADLPPLDESQDPVHVIHSDLSPAEDAEEPVHQPYRVWGRADWWLAWMKSASFPVLVTQGATSDLLPGALGQEGTMFRFGGGDVVPQDRQGGRFQLGAWLVNDECIGVEVGGMFLASRSFGIGLASPGTPAVARPFFNLSTLEQDASLVTFPALASGQVDVQSGTRLYGADGNLQVTLNSSKDCPVRFFAGFRYLDLHDDLDIEEDVQLNAAAPVYTGQQIGVRDNFACDNYFYGGNIGLNAAYNLRRLEVQATAQCALGLCQECVNVFGLTSITGAGGTQTFPAGLLAVSSNSGSRTRNAFAVVPEADLDARYEVTRHLFVSVGYSFLYWSQVARAGQQVDTNVNPDLVPTSKSYGQPTVLPQPQLTVRDTDFYVHGLHLGVELRF